MDLYLHKKLDFNPHALHCLFSANRWEERQRIINYLLDGITVVCDRYILSGIAYSMAQGVDKSFCISTEIGLVKPDSINFFSNYTPIIHRQGERYDNKFMQSNINMIMNTQMGDLLDETCMRWNNLEHDFYNVFLNYVRNKILEPVDNNIKIFKGPSN